MKRTDDMVEMRGLLGLRIRQLRVSQRLTQEQLGLMIGVDRSHISRIECGTCNLTFDILLLISNGLDVAPSDLLVGIGLPTSADELSGIALIDPPSPNRSYHSAPL